MADVNHDLRAKLKILRLELTRKDYKALVSKLTDTVEGWRVQEIETSVWPTKAKMVRAFDKILMDVVNTKEPPAPLPTDDKGILDRVQAILKPLLMKPALALAVKNALEHRVFALPWKEIEAGSYVRYDTREGTNDIRKILGMVTFQSRDTLLNGLIQETWDVKIWLPDSDATGTGTQHSYGDAKAMVDLALQSEGIILLDRDPIKVPHPRW